MTPCIKSVGQSLTVKAMLDRTYCINTECPFKDCDRHLSKIQSGTGYVSIANFDGVCERYIGYLVDELNEENVKGEQYD